MPVKQKKFIRFLLEPTFNCATFQTAYNAIHHRDVYSAIPFCKFSSNKNYRSFVASTEKKSPFVKTLHIFAY